MSEGGDQPYRRVLQFIGRILGDRRTRGIFALFASVISVRAAVQALQGKYDYPQNCYSVSRRAWCAFVNWITYHWGLRGIAAVHTAIALLLLLLCVFDFLSRPKIQRY